MTTLPIDTNHRHADNCQCMGDHCIFFGEDPYDEEDER